jgi:hypothetical protein
MTRVVLVRDVIHDIHIDESRHVVYVQDSETEVTESEGSIRVVRTYLPPILLNIRGSWDAATAYAVNDWVTYLGSSYICILACTGKPPADTAYWTACSLAGADGTPGINEPGLRLTLVPGYPVYNGDALPGSNVYYEPSLSGKIQLWDGTSWVDRTITSVMGCLGGTSVTGTTVVGSAVISVDSSGYISPGMAVTGTGIPADATVVSVDSYTQITISSGCTASGSATLTCYGLPDTVYDIFVYWEESVDLPYLKFIPWASITGRAESLGTQDGFRVWDSDHRWLYVGTCAMNTSLQVSDKRAYRGLWNMFNRVPRKLKVTETAKGWTYSGGWRPYNNNTANRVYVVSGLMESFLQLEAISSIGFYGGGVTGGSIGIGFNRINGSDAEFAVSGGGPFPVPVRAPYSHQPLVGLWYYQMMEKSVSTDAVVFSPYETSGMVGWVLA